VKAVVQACREGWRKYLDDPSAGNQRMHELNSEMDLDTFKQAADTQKPLIETEETRANGLGTMTLERWKTLAQQLVELKVIDNAPPAEACFVNLK
jgi:NitT/TauT family transport system substrate-binding protein